MKNNRSLSPKILKENEGDESKNIEADMSQVEVERCPICLNCLSEQVAYPENCSHLFCLNCILKWAEAVPICPVDRIPFEAVYQRNSGQSLIKIQVNKICQTEDLKCCLKKKIRKEALFSSPFEGPARSSSEEEKHFRKPFKKCRVPVCSRRGPSMNFKRQNKFCGKTCSQQTFQNRFCSTVFFSGEIGQSLIFEHVQSCTEVLDAYDHEPLVEQRRQEVGFSHSTLRFPARTCRRDVLQHVAEPCVMLWKSVMPGVTSPLNLMPGNLGCIGKQCVVTRTQGGEEKKSASASARGSKNKSESSTPRRRSARNSKSEDSQSLSSSQASHSESESLNRNNPSSQDATSASSEKTNAKRRSKRISGEGPSSKKKKGKSPHKTSKKSSSDRCESGSETTDVEESELYPLSPGSSADQNIMESSELHQLSTKDDSECDLASKEVSNLSADEELEFTEEKSKDISATKTLAAPEVLPPPLLSLAGTLNFESEVITNKLLEKTDHIEVAETGILKEMLPSQAVSLEMEWSCDSEVKGAESKTKSLHQEESHMDVSETESGDYLNPSQTGYSDILKTSTECRPYSGVTEKSNVSNVKTECDKILHSNQSDADQPKAENAEERIDGLDIFSNVEQNGNLKPDLDPLTVASENLLPHSGHNDPTSQEATNEFSRPKNGSAENLSKEDQSDAPSLETEDCIRTAIKSSSPSVCPEDLESKHNTPSEAEPSRSQNDDELLILAEKSSDLEAEKASGHIESLHHLKDSHNSENKVAPVIEDTCLKHTVLDNSSSLKTNNSTEAVVESKEPLTGVNQDNVEEGIKSHTVLMDEEHGLEDGHSNTEAKEKSDTDLNENVEPVNKMEADNSHDLEKSDNIPSECIEHLRREATSDSTRIKSEEQLSQSSKHLCKTEGVCNTEAEGKATISLNESTDCITQEKTKSDHMETEESAPCESSVSKEADADLEMEENFNTTVNKNSESMELLNLEVDSNPIQLEIKERKETTDLKTEPSVQAKQVDSTESDSKGSKALENTKLESSMEQEDANISEMSEPLKTVHNEHLGQPEQNTELQTENGSVISEYDKTLGKTELSVDVLEKQMLHKKEEPCLSGQETAELPKDGEEVAVSSNIEMQPVDSDLANVHNVSKDEQLADISEPVNGESVTMQTESLTSQLVCDKPEAESLPSDVPSQLSIAEKKDDLESTQVITVDEKVHQLRRSSRHPSKSQPLQETSKQKSNAQPVECDLPGIHNTSEVEPTDISAQLNESVKMQTDLTSHIPVCDVSEPEKLQSDVPLQLNIAEKKDDLETAAQLTADEKENVHQLRKSGLRSSVKSRSLLENKEENNVQPMECDLPSIHSVTEVEQLPSSSEQLNREPVKIQTDSLTPQLAACNKSEPEKLQSDVPSQLAAVEKKGDLKTAPLVTVDDKVPQVKKFNIRFSLKSRALPKNINQDSNVFTKTLNEKTKRKISLEQDSSINQKTEEHSLQIQNGKTASSSFLNMEQKDVKMEETAVSKNECPELLSKGEQSVITVSIKKKADNVEKVISCKPESENKEDTGASASKVTEEKKKLSVEGLEPMECVLSSGQVKSEVEKQLDISKPLKRESVKQKLENLLSGSTADNKKSKEVAELVNKTEQSVSAVDNKKIVDSIEKVKVIPYKAESESQDSKSVSVPKSTEDKNTVPSHEGLESMECNISCGQIKSEVEKQVDISEPLKKEALKQPSGNLHSQSTAGDRKGDQEVSPSLVTIQQKEEKSRRPRRSRFHSPSVVWTPEKDAKRSCERSRSRSPDRTESRQVCDTERKNRGRSQSRSQTEGKDSADQNDKYDSSQQKILATAESDLNAAGSNDKLQQNQEIKKDSTVEKVDPLSTIFETLSSDKSRNKSDRNEGGGLSHPKEKWTNDNWKSAKGNDRYKKSIQEKKSDDEKRITQEKKAEDDKRSIQERKNEDDKRNIQERKHGDDKRNILERKHEDDKRGAQEKKTEDIKREKLSILAINVFESHQDKDERGGLSPQLREREWERERWTNDDWRNLKGNDRYNRNNQEREIENISEWDEPMNIDDSFDPFDPFSFDSARNRSGRNDRGGRYAEPRDRWTDDNWRNARGNDRFRRESLDMHFQDARHENDQQWNVFEYDPYLAERNAVLPEWDEWGRHPQPRDRWTEDNWRHERLHDRFRRNLEMQHEDAVHEQPEQFNPCGYERFPLERRTHDLPDWITDRARAGFDNRNRVFDTFTERRWEENKHDLPRESWNWSSSPDWKPHHEQGPLRELVHEHDPFRKDFDFVEQNEDRGQNRHSFSLTEGMSGFDDSRFNDERSNKKKTEDPIETPVDRSGWSSASNWAARKTLPTDVQDYYSKRGKNSVSESVGKKQSDEASAQGEFTDIESLCSWIGAAMEARDLAESESSARNPAVSSDLDASLSDQTKQPNEGSRLPEMDQQLDVQQHATGVQPQSLRIQRQPISAHPQSLNSQQQSVDRQHQQVSTHQQNVNVRQQTIGTHHQASLGSQHQASLASQHQAKMNSQPQAAVGSQHQPAVSAQHESSLGSQHHPSISMQHQSAMGMQHQPSISLQHQVTTGVHHQHQPHVGVQHQTFMGAQHQPQPPMAAQHQQSLGAHHQPSMNSQQSSLSTQHQASLGIRHQVAMGIRQPNTMGVQPQMPHQTAMGMPPQMPHQATLGMQPQLPHQTAMGMQPQLPHQAAIGVQPQLPHQCLS